MKYKTITINTACSVTTPGAGIDHLYRWYVRDDTRCSVGTLLPFDFSHSYSITCPRSAICFLRLLSLSLNILSTRPTLTRIIGWRSDKSYKNITTSRMALWCCMVLIPWVYTASALSYMLQHRQACGIYRCPVADQRTQIRCAGESDNSPGDCVRKRGWSVAGAGSMYLFRF